MKKAQSIFDAAASKGEKDISHSINTREEKLDEEKKKKKLKRRKKNKNSKSQKSKINRKRNKSKSLKQNKKNQMMVKGKDVKKNEIGKNMKKMRNKKYKKIEKKMKNKKKKNGMKGKGIKRKNAKKGKGKKKGNNRKSHGKKKKYKKQSVRQSTNCSALTCLNNMVLSLKIEKATVRNFLAQEKRVASKLKLMVNKQGKSDDRHEAVKYLESRIGNLTAVKKQGALCAGEYNSTKGQNVSNE